MEVDNGTGFKMKIIQREEMTGVPPERPLREEMRTKKTQPT